MSYLLQCAFQFLLVSHHLSFVKLLLIDLAKPMSGENHKFHEKVQMMQFLTKKYLGVNSWPTPLTLWWGVAGTCCNMNTVVVGDTMLELDTQIGKEFRQIHNLQMGLLLHLYYHLVIQFACGTFTACSFFCEKWYFIEAESDNSKQLVPTLTAVPDSCCLKAQPGCGKAAFTDDISGATVRDSSLRWMLTKDGIMKRKSELCFDFHIFLLVKKFMWMVAWQLCGWLFINMWCQHWWFVHW